MPLRHARIALVLAVALASACAGRARKPGADPSADLDALIAREVAQARAGQPNWGLIQEVDRRAVAGFRMRRYTEAERLARAAVELHEAAYGPEHREVASRLERLAGIEDALERPADAERTLQRARGIYDGDPSVGDDARIRVLVALGVVVARQQRYPEALALLEDGRTRAVQAFGATSAEVATVLRVEANVYRAAGQPAEATACERKAVAIERTAGARRRPRGTSSPPASGG